MADSKTKFDAYSPLYHLLSKRLLDRHALPTLKRGLWPHNMANAWTDEILPDDFAQRLSLALAEHVWPYLESGSGMRAFSSGDSLVLLSHDLDFWLPHAITMMESRMRNFERVEPETDEQRRIVDEAKEHEDDPDVGFARPRRGGILWMGEEEAQYATEEMVEAADKDGYLRRMIDAIRSNPVAPTMMVWSGASARMTSIRRSPPRIQMSRSKGGSLRTSKKRAPGGRPA